MKGYLKGCWQRWVDMWFLGLGCLVFVLSMCHFVYEVSWSVSFLAVASLLACAIFIPEALCRLERGPGR